MGELVLLIPLVLVIAFLWALNGFPGIPRRRRHLGYELCCPTPQIVTSNTVDSDGVGEIYCAACGFVHALTTESGAVIYLDTWVSSS